MTATTKRTGSLPRLVLTVGVLVAVVGGLGLSRVLGQAGGDTGRKIPDSKLMPKAEPKAADAPPPPEPENLLPEYARLVDREGTVIRKAVGAEGGIRTVFRSADEKLELVLLENRYLETLEDVTDHGRKAAKLRVSGTVTVYRGANYLLLSRVQIKQP